MEFRKIRQINILLITILVIMLLISMISYFKPLLYLSDKYSWHTYMGDKHVITDQKSKVLNHYNKALEIDPERPEAHEKMIRYYSLIRSPERMNTHLKTLDLFYEEGKEPSLDYFLIKGFRGLKKCNLVEAEYYFKEGIKTDEESFENYFGLGNVYLMMDDYELSLYYFDETISCYRDRGYKDISSALGHYGKGLVYEDRDQKINADIEFEIARGLWPIVDSFRYFELNCTMESDT